jgi:acyl-CoA synthetase (AMP-forming)/AMP-acid ligase II
VHGEVPIAAVELAEGARVDERELTRFAREALGLRAPRRVIIVDALPSTANGKVDVRSLAALATTRR